MATTQRSHGIHSWFIQMWARELSTMAEHCRWWWFISLMRSTKSLITFLFTTAIFFSSPSFAVLISKNTMHWNIISVKCCVLCARYLASALSLSLSIHIYDLPSGICNVRIKIGWHRRKGEFTVYAMEVTWNVVCHQRSVEDKRHDHRNEHAVLFKAFFSIWIETMPKRNQHE